MAISKGLFDHHKNTGSVFLSVSPITTSWITILREEVHNNNELSYSGLLVDSIQYSVHGTDNLGVTVLEQVKSICYVYR